MGLGVCDIVVVHRSGVGFYRCECDRVCGFRIEEKGLKDWSKLSKGVCCYGNFYHIAVKEVANDGVADGGGACNFVGFVFTSDLLFFVFL